jgi:3-hydroxyisobutyrate dehydrogenase-like beta-hydroxyacid dehydrogenase
MESLSSHGLIGAGSIAEVAADTDAVFIILPSLDSVEATVTGAKGLIGTAPLDCTLIQMSTISPELTRRLGAAAAAKGFGFLDAPISGTSAMVGRGDCTIFVAGERKQADRCQTAFAAIAKKWLYVGAIGMASLAKLATNLIVGLNTAALAEAFVLAAKGGLEPKKLIEILNESAADSKMLEVRGPLMADHRFDAEMKIDLFLKDFKLMLEEGLRLGVPLPLTAITQQITLAAATAGLGDKDLAAIMLAFERLAGLQDHR